MPSIRKPSVHENNILIPLTKSICGNDSYQIQNPKTKDTIRIIFLGESSVERFCTFDYLHELLSRNYHSLKFDIVNLGVPGATTTMIKEGLIYSALSYSPDMIILYAGNNEYIEFDYSSKSFFMQNRLSPLNKLYSYNFIFERYQIIKSKLIRADFMRKQLHRTFENNIKSIASEVKSNSNAQFVLTKIASNTADAPFRSEYFKASAQVGDPSAYPLYAGIDGWILRLKEDAPRENSPTKKLISGLRLLQDDKISESIGIYKELKSEINEPDPFLEYYLANIYYSQSNFKKAKQHFQNAIDIDDRPYRITTKINSIIERAAVENNLPLIDVYSRIENESSNNIIGYNLFIDHVHLNDKGNKIAMEELYLGISRYLDSKANFTK